MSDLVYNISPASLTLGAVLARGADGVTLYKAQLLQGQTQIQVPSPNYLSVVSACYILDTKIAVGGCEAVSYYRCLGCCGFGVELDEGGPYCTGCFS